MTPCPTRPRLAPPLVGALLALLAAGGMADGRAHAAPGASPLAPNVVTIHSDAQGFKLRVDGRDFMVLGMNWTYIPVDENYRYDLFAKSDAFIEAALEREMGLLKRMGGNAIRLFPGIPPRWVTYIYEKYGIYTVMNHTTGRYGFEVDGAYVSPVDYSEPRFREVVRADVRKMVETYRGVPGVVMWLLGNENNYGLEWSSYEIEALPQGEQQAAKAVHLYSLWGDIVGDIKALDRTKPVGLANGDLQYLDLIKEHVLPRGLDIMGANVYRGPSSGDLFQRVRDELGLPFLYTEFGSDAYNAREDREDQLNQALVNKALWAEVFEQTYGKGRAGNALGGLHFQWSDGWWKYLQETNLDVHDTHASWPNQAYLFDWADGQNNMNEEWFGVCAKGPRDDTGQFPLYPRASYYVLQKGFQQDPYDPATTLDAVRAHWGAIDVEALAAPYEAARVGAELELLKRFKVSDIRMEFTTFSTGGDGLDDPAREERRFDHMESFYVDLGFQPIQRLKGDLELSLIANVPTNPIDEIFYEQRGETRVFTDATGEEVVIRDLERFKIHGASFEWDDTWFTLEGFYRKGHYHWGYEGDFFGFYPEANYGPNIDVYNADAPFGFVLTGKQAIDGLKVAFGPEIYWGANPSVVAKYRRIFGKLALTVVHHEDIARAGTTVAASNAVPEQKTRRTSLHLATKRGPFKIEAGALTSGSTKIGDRFLIPEETDGASYLGSGYRFLEDTVAFADTLGAKGKLTYERGNIRWYLQGAYKGLVADGGGDPTVTFTGWRLKEEGRGNHWNVLGGAAFNLGYFQVAPNLIYQRPLVGPLPLVEERFNAGNGVYFPTIKGRNILEDPFVVRGNREQLGAELMITYDPTPGTWLWSWDNEIVEDAPFAFTLDLVYRHLPTIQDGGVGRLQDGTAFGFATSAPAQDLYEVNARGIFNPGYDFKIIADLWGGTGQANGDDDRLVRRFGTRVRLAWWRLGTDLSFKLNDWGPYDYHRDFNFTFPLQLSANLSYALQLPRWLGYGYTRFGVQAQLRTLDENSNRFRADPSDPDARGSEWEIRSFFHVML